MVFDRCYAKSTHFASVNPRKGSDVARIVCHVKF